MIVRVAAAFLASGFLKAGTPSAMASMPVRATAPDEKPRSRRNRLSCPPASIPWNSSGDGRRDLRQVAQDVLPAQAVDDEQGEADDVGVGGDGEDEARLLQPPQVGDGDEQDEAEADAPPGAAARPRKAGSETMAATPAEIDTATVRM